MKPLTITLAALALSAHALASAPLPFVGERQFNFEQAACSQHTITIAPNGQTTVQLIGCQHTVQLYQGPYQPDLPVSGGDPDAAYYQIQGAHIYKLNAQRQPLTGCAFGPGAPCRAELTAP